MLRNEGGKMESITFELVEIAESLEYTIEPRAPTIEYELENAVVSVETIPPNYGKITYDGTKILVS